MRKATEATSANEKVETAVEFQLLAKNQLRQQFAPAFICQSTDGDYIALLGSRSELVTLELSSKSTIQLVLPYFEANFKCSKKIRPLDELSKKVDLQQLYERSNVLEMQQLSLNPAYTAICSQNVPMPNILAASWSPHPLPDGQMLLGSLNSVGALLFLTKNEEDHFWHQYELGLDVAASLRDTLQPPYEVEATQINTFKHYQACVDRCWITMFAWRPLDTADGSYGLVLGTAAGSLWTLTLSPDATTIVSHCELHTLLGRICYMHILKDLLLVGDNNGLVHLYRFTDATDEEGLTLVKPLWLRPDHMGLQQGLITHCPERDCYYIVCCKAAHLLIWCMPNPDTDSWLETRLLVGGMKITALCSLQYSSYALATASGKLYRIELIHKTGQLSTSKQLITIEDSEQYYAVGLVSSSHKNLLTVLFTRNKEYLHSSTKQRKKLFVCVGKVQKDDVLAQLAENLSPREPINCFKDILADMRLHILNCFELEKYANYAPLDMFAFDELATDKQLEQLQIKYHVLTALIHIKYLQFMGFTERDMQLLLAMLALTHMRLRLQYLSTLKELTEFQLKASQCMLSESLRVRQQLEQKLSKQHTLNVTIKRFLTQMEIHFEALQHKLGIADALETTAEEESERCSISYVQLTPTLDKHYCTLCNRLASPERQLLLELYEQDSKLLCPWCHGAYVLELFEA